MNCLTALPRAVFIPIFHSAQTLLLLAAVYREPLTEALVYSSQGQLQEALHYFERARGIFERAGRVIELISLYVNLGILYEGLQECEKAEEPVSDAVQLAEEVGHPQLEVYRELLERIRQKRNRAA